MQKPENKAIKDFIMEKVSKDLQFTEETVEAVVGWAYKKANQASHNNREIEISGIGKLLMSQAKLRKQLVKLERIESRLTDEVKLAQVRELIAELKIKQDVK